VEVDLKVKGICRVAAFRAGADHASTVQEDHIRSKVIARGYPHGFNPATDDACDLNQYIAFDGYDNWSNDRRHVHEYLEGAYYGTGLRSLKTGVDLIRYDFDKVRDMFRFGGAQTQFTVRGGEAENCQRIMIDELWGAHAGRAMIANSYIKLDLWRPDLPLPTNFWPDELNATYGNALGTWGTRGGIKMTDVTVGSLPVRRHPNGKLYYVTNLRTNPDGSGIPLFDFTEIPAPRFHVASPVSMLKTVDCRAHGYKSGREFTYTREGGRARHEHWQPTEYDGTATGIEMAAVNQYTVAA
jgi:hypothetical protein